VFEFLADFKNIPRWNYYVLNVSQLTPGSAGKGTIYFQERKSDNQTFKIVEYIINQKLVVETLAGSQPYFKREMILVEKSDFTELNDAWLLDTKFPLFIEKMFLKKVKTSIKQNLLKLSDLLENKKVVLQNGREMVL